jgi:16S rRNA U1498 N3-methylase RsmE
VRRFPAPTLPARAGPVTLDPSASHHLLRVVGIAPGEEVELYTPDGRVGVAALVRVEEGIAGCS